MESKTSQDPVLTEFSPGSSVIYAMHGKCYVLGTETRTLGGELIRFYKLEIRRSPLSRSNRQDTAIWVPVLTAKAKGLRLPMSREDAQNAMKTLQSREYYFKTCESWTVIQPLLEATIRFEGGVGLAKVASYLYVLKRKQIVASPEVTKLQETVHKLLFRELSEALDEPAKIIEEKINRGFRTKMLPDT